jgi:hypothetical protein
MLTGSIVVNYNRYNDRQKVKQAALTLKNNLRLAQTKASAAEWPLSCVAPGCICSQLSGYTVSYTGNSYSIRALCSEGLVGTDQSVTLPIGITFATVPPSMTFQVLSRGVTIATPAVISLTGSAVTYDIQLSPSGDVNDLGFQ